MRPHARGLGPCLPDPTFPVFSLTLTLRHHMWWHSAGSLGVLASPYFWAEGSECPSSPSPALPDAHLCSKYDHGGVF